MLICDEYLAPALARRGLRRDGGSVYCGPDELGGLGAWGEWNVGNWVGDVHGAWIRQDL